MGKGPEVKRKISCLLLRDELEAILLNLILQREGK
jgi:hypothetical protein